MLIDLTVIPLRGGRHISDEVAEVIKLIDASGLPYQLTPSGTCIEGEWEVVMPFNSTLPQRRPKHVFPRGYLYQD